MARADAVLKNLPREALDELWELKNPPDEETKAMTLTAISAYLPERFKVELGKTALGEFYQWLALQRRMWARESMVDQVKEILAKDKSLSVEQVKAAGQRLFMADGILEKDVNVFAVAANLEGADYRAKQKDLELALRKESNELAREKLTAATRSKIEAGLDALYQEIKGNAPAEKIFKQLQEVVKKG
jgi:hypothetical protein